MMRIVTDPPAGAPTPAEPRVPSRERSLEPRASTYDAASFEAGQACATRVAACLAHLSALELMDGARWWNRWARRLMAAALVAHAEALESAAERNAPLPRPEGWA
jgi:hypothetical protein